MEQLLNFALKLSLEEMALRRVVINFWNETSVLVSVENVKLECGCETDYQITVKDTVKAKVSTLMLPESLKKRMMDLVNPIGSGIFRWKIFHESVLNWSHQDLDIHILKQLCWTSAGSVDYRKTAEKLLRLGLLDVWARYILASLYCVVDYIPVLWQELPESIRKCYLPKSFVLPVREMKMESYWACILMGEESKLVRIGSQRLRQDVSFHQRAFERYARRGNKGAAEYFFKKLNDEERNTSLFKAAHIARADTRRNSPRTHCDFPTENRSDVLCYLLSLMNREQQIQVLKEIPCEILTCFLEWPWQDLFLELADLCWTFIPEYNYGYLLLLMSKSIENSDYCFPDLFRKFYQCSPSPFKYHFINFECQFGYYFTEFFKVEDTETIKLILRTMSAERRVLFVSSFTFFRFLDPLIMADKFHLVEPCFQEVTPSKEDMKNVKKKYQTFFTRFDSRGLKLRRLKWRRFFQVMNETDASASSKRCPSERNLRSAKKLRSEEKKDVLVRK